MPEMSPGFSPDRKTLPPAADTTASAYTDTPFEDFFEQESPTLFRRLCLDTGNRHEAEDVMQETFLKIYERWERIRTLDDPLGYLYRTAFNTYRKRSRRAALALRRTLNPAEYADVFAAAEARSVVASALATLTPRQRAALVLTELLGFDSAEAGKALGIRPATVRALSHQARAAMRRTVGGEHG